MFATWQLNVALGVIVSVLFFQFYKRAVRHAANDTAATILLQLIAGFSILLLAPLFPLRFPSRGSIWILLLVSAIFFAVNDRLNTTVRKHLDVSVAIILTQLKHVFVILIGMTVFQEGLIWNRLLGALLIILGNFLLFWKNQHIKLDKYTLFSFGASFSFAIALSIDVGISPLFNLPIYIALTLLLPAVILVLGSRVRWQDVVREYNSEARRSYLATGLSWGVMIFFILRAYRFGDVTMITPLLATTVIFNVVLAYLFQNERSYLLRKISAATLIVVGVLFTVYTFGI